MSNSDDGDMDPEQVKEAKRKHHRENERVRRNYKKSALNELKKVVPKLQQITPTEVQILKETARYIEHLKNCESDNQKRVQQLISENKLFEEESMDYG